MRLLRLKLKGCARNKPNATKLRRKRDLDTKRKNLKRKLQLLQQLKKLKHL